MESEALPKGLGPVGIDHLLDQSTEAAFTIDAGKSVADALDVMALAGIDAVVVTAEKRPVGIFTVSDMPRCQNVRPVRPLDKIFLHEVMTNKVITAAAADFAGDVLDMMFKAGIGHVPVVKEGAICGLLKLRTLAGYHLENLKTELDQIKDYVEALHQSEID